MDHLPKSMHLVVLPVPLVCFHITPVVCSKSVNLIEREFSFVEASVFKLKLSLPMLLPPFPSPLVLFPVSPSLYPKPLSQVLRPFPFVYCSIETHVLPLALCLVTHPLSLLWLRGLIALGQLAVPMRFVESPVSLVNRTVTPLYFSFSMLHTPEPLSSVGRPIFEFYLWQKSRLFQLHSFEDEVVVNLVFSHGDHVIVLF